ncbi:hypothetical protein EKS17_09465 [Streptococcus mutans]|nr:hypothetical protein [Streptococcus mutans]
MGNGDSEAVSIKTTIVLIVEEYSLKTIKKSILNDAVSSVRYLYPKLINSTIFRIPIYHNLLNYFPL